MTACSAPERAREGSDAPTIVSLNPCIDAILVEVARPEQILALSHYSSDPKATSMDVARAREYGVTGGTAEEIIALEPDIVLASSFLAPATRNALERLGVKVETFGNPKSVEESQAQVSSIARIVGDGSEGSTLRQEMEHRFWPPFFLPSSRLKEPDFGPDPSAMLWQTGQIVPGENQLVSQLIRESGFSDHAAAIGLSQGEYVSLEQVISNPPDILFIAGDSVGQVHPALEAVEGMRVFPLPAQAFYCGGPSIFYVRDWLALARNPQTWAQE
ncbi:MAG: ABC transporter substrate-binding protein [Erythrobacter sp.]